jgi:hypothetical protein
MSIATSLVYDILFIADVTPADHGLQIAFRDGSIAFLDAAHPNFDVLRIHAESNRGRPVPVGVVLDAGGRIVDLNTAHDTAVQFIQDCPEDPNRLKVAFWGYSPVCYLTRDHPELERIRATLSRAMATQALVWVANHSEMVKDEPTTAEGEFEIWWKIMDVRPV